jgi:DNA polymerase-3 subunit epsilon
MRLLGLDFETTGLDPKNDVVTEVGAVLWDTERHSPVLIDNYFVFNGKTVLSDLIIRITGIQQKDLEEFGIPPQEGLIRLVELVEKCDAIVAHNKSFDKGFYDYWLNTTVSDAQEIKSVPWICSMNDIDYPEECKSKKLSYLASDHGFLNPFAHRAVFDVLTMLRVVDNYDISVILESAGQPDLVIEALVSFQNKDLARAEGFRWDAVKRKWLKTMKKAKWEASRFSFDTVEVK